MRQLLTLFIIALTSVTAMAESPQIVINALIERYPTAKRMVWYYFDESESREYLRVQFVQRRRALDTAEIDRLKKSFLDLWGATDFTRAQGAQFMGPDTMSMTINGERAAVFDLGKSTVSADYAFNVAARMRSPKPDFTGLLNAFEKVSAGHTTKSVPVKYTGFKPGVTFTFQRDKGRGWTQGERTTVYGASMEDFRIMRAAIRRFIGSKVPVTVFDRTWQVLVKSESTPDFYAVGYDPETKQMNFLHALVEDQICIPLDWQKIDYLTDKEIQYNR